MSGRNNKPKNNGPAASPGRLDQFGDRLGNDTEPKPMNRSGKPGSNC